MGVAVSEISQRNQNGHRKGHRKFAEQPPDNPAHQQNGDEHRDQRQTDGKNGEADFPRAPQRRLHRGHPLLQVARDIFDHHDRIVDDETGGNRQCH